MAEGSSNRITVTVKTPKEKQNIECAEDETVEKVNFVRRWLAINSDHYLEIARKNMK